MGRQVQFHALSTDIQGFLKFVQERDPVIVTLRDSDSPEVSLVTNPSAETRVMTLWNQTLLSSLRRKHIAVPGRDYYTFDGSLPIVELSPPQRLEWNGRQSLLSGRLYASFDSPVPSHRKWYESLDRWIRNHFIKNPIPRLASYVGYAAYNWFKEGGLLLPWFPPPFTSQWLSWVEAQDQHRAVFSK